MTEFEIRRLPFEIDQIEMAGRSDDRLRNWPIVYTLNNAADVYVGESLNAVTRMHQHSATPEKQDFETVRVILDDTFNKSVCLDLESSLIRWFAGEGAFKVRNRNIGITDAEYFDRTTYQQRFKAIFDQLRDQGLFGHSIPEIENSDLFKLSPYKALTDDQAAAVVEILDAVSDDVRAGIGSTTIVQGDPGTGKTVIAVYLAKLLHDISETEPEDVVDIDSVFVDFFLGEHREALSGLSVGLVIPQQSLRVSVARVFRTIPGMSEVSVLSPFDVGELPKRVDGRPPFDLLIVDEAHRLNHRANQPSGAQNKRFRQINEHLFGADNKTYTQLDWVREQSRFLLLLVDTAQRVRPADLPESLLRAEIDRARTDGRLHRLHSQLRVKAGEDYIAYIRAVLSEHPPVPIDFSAAYDLRFFDDLGAMHEAIRARDAEHGKSRLVAGFAWEWRSKRDHSAYDIVEDGVRLRWNSTPTDWIDSPGAIDEVGSIHTVQGYDLNYAGVIIGRDLQADPIMNRLIFSRDDYKDKKGKENNPGLGITYSDDDLLQYVLNIYRVLLTRGMLGTYVYVCDPVLRHRLRQYFTPQKRGVRGD